MVMESSRLLRWQKLQRPVLRRCSSKLALVSKARGQQLCLATSFLPDAIAQKVWRGNGSADACQTDNEKT